MKKVCIILSIIVATLILASCQKPNKKEVTHQEVFDSIVIGYEDGDSQDHVTQNIKLPTTSTFDGVKLSWISANENIISSTGDVNRPETQNIQVLLILEVIINGVSDEQNFLFTVIATNPIEEDVFYTVTFNSNGGSNVTSLSIKENGLISKPANPTKDGYIFDGWFKDSNLSNPWSFPNDTVTANVTLHAKWLVDGEKYNVTFNSNGGSDVNVQVINEGAKVGEPSNPTKDDHEFKGWFKDEDLTIPWNFDEDVVTMDITLYAKWAPIVKTFDVHFNTNGGNEIDALELEEGMVIPKPDTPIRNNYKFNGWYLDASYTTLWNFETDLLTDDVTLHASWYPEGIESGLTIYVVNFEMNGGQKTAPEFVANGHKLNELVDPTRNDYAFEGWYKDSDLTEPWDFTVDTVTKNLILYANWRQLPPKLPSPIHAIGHQPRPIAHIALGPYEFTEGDNGGYTGYGLVFTNLDTGEVFIWRKSHEFNAGFAANYNESDLANVGIVLTPGDYKLEYFAMGNGTTTRDSDVSYQSATFTIERTQLTKPLLVIDKDNQQLTWTIDKNVSSYEVYINDELQTGDTSPFDLSILTEPGLYEIKVIAKSDLYNSNEAIIEYVIVSSETPQLPIPENFELNGFILTWDAVDNAVGYKVIINGVEVQTPINSIDLIKFDIGNQTTTIKVIALGNLLEYAHSDEAQFEAELPDLLPRLNPMAIGDQNGDVSGYGNGFYRLIAHLGHPPYQQEDWSGEFRFVVKKDGVVLGELIGGNGQSLHTPGSSTDFYGKLLTNGEKYTIEISLIAKSGSGHRDSLPLVIEFTFIK